MGLDRQSIARRDFPTHRRGYEPAAVDAHLDRLADDVEALQRRAAEPATLSSQAGEQVRAIIQAAERGAQEIREQAAAEAREHVAGAARAAERLRARIDDLEAEIGQVIASLRTDADRLRADLERLGAEAGELGRGAPAEPAEVAAHDETTSPGEPAGDAAAARIVALDMALSGKPRDEIDRFLAEHYDVDDRAALLDEVYAAAGG